MSLLITFPPTTSVATSNSCTMVWVCPPVQGDNPRGIASGLSCTGGLYMVLLFNTTLICVVLAQDEIFRAEVCVFCHG